MVTERRSGGSGTLLGRLAEADREVLERYGLTRELGAGEALCAEGEPAQTFFLLLDGRVGLRTGSMDLGEAGAGAALCLAQLLAPGAAQITVRALAPGRVWQLSADALARLSEDAPPVASRLLNMLSMELAARLRSYQSALAAPPRGADAQTQCRRLGRRLLLGERGQANG